MTILFQPKKWYFPFSTQRDAPPAPRPTQASLPPICAAASPPGRRRGLGVLGHVPTIREAPTRTSDPLPAPSAYQHSRSGYRRVRSRVVARGLVSPAALRIARVGAHQELESDSPIRRHLRWPMVITSTHVSIAVKVRLPSRRRSSPNSAPGSQAPVHSMPRGRYGFDSGVSSAARKVRLFSYSLSNRLSRWAGFQRSPRRSTFPRRLCWSSGRARELFFFVLREGTAEVRTGKRRIEPGTGDCRRYCA